MASTFIADVLPPAIPVLRIGRPVILTVYHPQIIVFQKIVQINSLDNHDICSSLRNYRWRIKLWRILCRYLWIHFCQTIFSINPLLKLSCSILVNSLAVISSYQKGSLKIFAEHVVWLISHLSGMDFI